MAELTAESVLVGGTARVFLAGEELGTWTNFEATVTPNYEDVQIGFDVDRKAVSWQGTGSISHQATNSIGVKLFNQLKVNKDRRFVIEADITKSSTGEIQSIRLEGVTFDALPIAVWEKGGLVTNEMAFRFMPSASTFTTID